MKKFTVPKIYTGEGKTKEWYIWFRFNNKLIKRRDDINRIKNLKDRLAEAKSLQYYYHQKLKEGWNPLVPALPEILAAGYTLYQSLEFAISKKTGIISAITLKNYSGTLRFVKKAIQDLSLGELEINDTKRVHIKLILETIQKDRKWSNKAYNKALTHIQAILSELIQWDIIENNPAHKIKPLPVEESTANQAPTAEQAKTIIDYLSENYPEYFVFIAMEYHTGIRPVELTRLKIGMIDVERRLINMPAKITKNRKKGRVIPIINDLWQYLAPLMALQYPEYYFLFGSHRISGRGNEGKFTDFIPGPTQLKRDTSTKRWKRLIKDGLGIDISQYAMKRLGGDDKYRAGVPIEAIQTIFGHSSRSTTEIYVKAIQEHHRQVIIDKSPALRTTSTSHQQL